MLHYKQVLALAQVQVVQPVQQELPKLLQKWMPSKQRKLLQH
jgi:hypothetical protein